MTKDKNYKNSDLEEEFYDEEYLEDIEYVQASTLKDLEKKVRKKIEDYGTVEHNPFWDNQAQQWTQMVLYYNYDSEEEEK